MSKFLAVMCLLLLSLSASAQSQKDYSAAKIDMLRQYAKMQPAYVPLEVGEVKPRGWLRQWALDAANGITGHLDEYVPVFANGWRGFGFKAKGTNPEDGTGWPLEQCSYWLDGAIKLAYQVDDEALKQKIGSRLDIVVNGVVDKGAETFIWWKPKSFVDDHFANWSHGLMGRALVSYYQATHKPKVLRALTKVYEQFPLPLLTGKEEILDNYTEQMRGATNVDAMSDAFLASGDTAILNRLTEYARNPSYKQYEDLLSTIEQHNRYGFRSTHGVSFNEEVRVPAMLGVWSGDGNELQASLNFMDWGLKNNMLPLGVTSSDEQLAGIGAMRGVETCDVPASIWSYLWLTRITGNSRWLDLSELAFFNAGPAPISRDFKTMCYYQQLDRLSTVLPGETAHSAEVFKFTPYGYTTYCCVGSCNWIIPNYVQNMWMSTTDGGLAYVLYGPCEVRKMIGDATVELNCETDFPFDDEIKITLKTDARGLRIPLSFRVPEWTEDMTIKVNGRHQSVEPNANDMVRIEREWHDGDCIKLRLPMKARMIEGKETPYPRHYYYTRGYRGTGERINPLARDWVCGAPFQYVKYGPLLFSLPLYDVDENEVKPYQRFQFALNIKDADKDIKVLRSKMPQPWRWQIADAPIKLRVRACNTDWQPRWSETFPLKGVDKLRDTWLTLVPYNVTKFRVTLFPKLKEE